ncbi:MAG: Uma2 family endonuclease [Fimbriimonadales bacterium]|nr:Uma2 family endonuclease [Fimbriimonadales bacterium]
MATTLLAERPAQKPRQQARGTVRRYRFTPEQFHKLGEAGLFEPDTRLELIQGEIYEMTPIGPEHGFSADVVSRRILQIEKEGEYYTRFQNPLRLGNSEPIPDIAVVPGKPSDYKQQHPTTALLVIEIADTTLRHDRGRKLRLYARHNIPEYWILNLKERVLEVYREPARGRYQNKQVLGLDDAIRPLFNPAVELPVRSLFE